MKRRHVTRWLPKGVKDTLRNLFGKRILPPLVSASGVNLLDMTYRQLGVYNFQNDHVSGEHFLVNYVLPELLGGQKGLVLFDVGANVGKYTKALCDKFPSASIYSFEPVPDTYRALMDNVKGIRPNCVNAGLSDQEGSATIYTYGEGRASAHSTLFSKVISDVHHSKDAKGIDIRLTTLDVFIGQNGVKRVDFLKVDTEGNELRVLHGAKKAIHERLVGMIQFEFNEMNVFSRVFLHDFYEALPGHDFYRLLPRGLLPLGDYTPRNEIFVFQNILAVDRERYPRRRMASFE